MVWLLQIKLCNFNQQDNCNAKLDQWPSILFSELMSFFPKLTVLYADSDGALREQLAPSSDHKQGLQLLLLMSPKLPHKRLLSYLQPKAEYKTLSHHKEQCCGAAQRRKGEV